MWTDRQAVEIFHLLFLRAFGARVDKTLFALKGGCNLRFFLKSIRYSEDMDLDIQTMSVPTLANNVNRVLGDRAFVQSLRAQDMEVSRISAPKQTGSTQRWKIALRLSGSSWEFPTKIEFSRRGLDDGTSVGPTDPAIIRSYRLYPVIVQHYALQAAFAQKVSALALRQQIQARDVFDLKLLLDNGAAVGALPVSAATRLPAAIENAMAVGYDAFAGQVLAYLEPEYQEYYRPRQVWEETQQQVIDTLTAMRP